MKIRIISITIILSALWYANVCADTIYLKNGREIEGFAKNEDSNAVEVDIGFGTVKLRWDEVERIEKSSLEESSALREKWQRKKERDAREREYGPQQINVAREQGHIIVDAVLNKKVTATLLMDTGASYVVVSQDIWKKLGGSGAANETILPMQLADGRKVNARLSTLDSISVQGVEARDVPVAILSEEATGSIGFKDGLLGMSFLNRFNFKVDQKNNKLILEKLER